jgi:hypothetical protein
LLTETPEVPTATDPEPAAEVTPELSMTIVCCDGRGCGHVFGLLMRAMAPAGPDVVR